MPLNRKQQRFVEEFIVDLNGTKAAIRAGYSIRSAYAIASALLSKHEIQAAITAERRKQSERTGVTADRIILELARIALADIRDIAQWGETVAIKDAETGEERLIQGLSMVPSSDLTPDMAASIAEVSHARDGTLRVKLHDKNSALEKLGRHLRLFPSSHEVSGPNGAPIPVEETVKPPRELAKMLLSLIQQAHREEAAPQPGKNSQVIERKPND
ncbi:terminase small subunit [Labrys sp. ZIDIC5]|uniref:terminase small subunit n=1 Tax=Labrys sedimenti TaxID=3106036 RepID=UPI002ACAF4D4|nr:terminase small subunit [Labrys sp. ZIDIC5]MDZ5448619.1 terminase small subunit [Labrys sp. ZIDIC5]